MEYPDFSFYNSENDGYRGGFGDYTDPIPTSGGPAHSSEPPKKKGRGQAHCRSFAGLALLWAAERALAARPCIKV